VNPVSFSFSCCSKTLKGSRFFSGWISVDRYTIYIALELHLSMIVDRDWVNDWIPNYNSQIIFLNVARFISCCDARSPFLSNFFSLKNLLPRPPRRSYLPLSPHQ